MRELETKEPGMDQDLCVEFAIRSAIMDLLTEAQIARLCAGTGLVPLMSGDEYRQKRGKK